MGSVDGDFEGFQAGEVADPNALELLNSSLGARSGSLRVFSWFLGVNMCELVSYSQPGYASALIFSVLKLNFS